MPKVNFIARSLKQLLNTVNFSEKPLLLIVLKPEHPTVEQTVRELVTDVDCCKLINDNFIPTGILTTASEMRTVLTFAAETSFPCLLAIRLVEKGGKKEIKVDTMVLLASKNPKMSVTIENIQKELSSYLKRRNEQGGRFKILERGEVHRAKEHKEKQLQGERE